MMGLPARYTAWANPLRVWPSKGFQSTGLWSTAGEMTFSSDGSKITRSPSLPGARVPLRGYMPNARAGLALSSSTILDREIRPALTP